MKNILKKLNIMSKQSENEQGSCSSEGNKSNHGSISSSKRLLSTSWLHSVGNRKSLSSTTSLNQGKVERMEPSDTVRTVGLDVFSDSDRRDSGCTATGSRDPEVEEEYQLQLALELSAKEDPEAVQIEAVKEISLGSCYPYNTPAEIVAYRYWIYPCFTELQCSWL